MKNKKDENYSKRILKSKIIIFICIILIIISTLNISIQNDIKVNNEDLRNTQLEINSFCNKALTDIEGSELEITNSLKYEKDDLKRGMYNSALVLINSVKGDYDKALSFGDEAVENYLKVDKGQYYSISEYKYLSWVLLRGGRFTQSFRITKDLIELINKSQNLLTDGEVKELEAHIYMIFLNIYCELGVKSNVEFYYKKLNEIEFTDEIKISMGDRIAYSKILAAEVMEDYELMKKNAEEAYELIAEIDKIKGIETKDASLINLAYANLMNGKLDEALEQIIVAEEYYKKMGDYSAMATIYTVYAKYYELTNNINEAFKNYDKVIDIYESAGDNYRLKNILISVINLMKDNEIKDDIGNYYFLYEKTDNKLSEENEVNKLLVENIKITEELNKTIFERVKEYNRSIKIISITLIILIVLIIIFIREIISLIRLKNSNKEVLRSISEIDYLTGAHTRLYGLELLDILTKNKENFILAMLDIDDFKNINDSKGHIIGDEVLKRVSKRIINNIESKDKLIRFGGEEFLIIFKDKTIEETNEILYRIQRVLKYDKSLNLKITFSAGIVESSYSSELHEVINKADKLLYSAKKMGKDRIEI